MPSQLKRQYIELKKLAAADLGGSQVANQIVEMVNHARTLLEACEPVDAPSVNRKNYFVLRRTVESRPVNAGAYIHDPQEMNEGLESFLAGMPRVAPEQITRTMYTMALSVFAANDVHVVGRKASATFFEILIGHTISRILGISSRKKVRMPESDV